MSIAIEYKCYDIVELLIRSGADVNACDEVITTLAELTNTNYHYPLLSFKAII